MHSRLISNVEAARYLGFHPQRTPEGKPTPPKSFYEYCRKAGIEPVPHRKGFYDTNQINSALDKLHGITAANDENKDEADKWLEQNG